MTTIDLNADMGEGAGADAALMALVSSASIACGGHAGDAETMRKTLRLAKEHGVAVGAHPGFADKENFGRIRIDLPAQALTELVKVQVEALLAIADEEGVRVRYVKLHGALANMAAEDMAVAQAALRGAQAARDGLAVLALDKSAQVVAAEALGMRVVREAYADRAYDDDGMLVSRERNGAVLRDVQDVVGQVLEIAVNRRIKTLDGVRIATTAQSICLHSDTANVEAFASRIALALQNAGVEVAAPY